MVTLFGHTDGAFSEIGTVGDKFMLSSDAVVFNEDDFGFPRSYGSRNGYRDLMRPCRPEYKLYKVSMAMIHQYI